MKSSDYRSVSRRNNALKVLEGMYAGDPRPERPLVVIKRKEVAGAKDH